MIARVFALLALAIVTIVVIAVVSSSTGDSGSASTTSTSATAPPKPKPKDPYYVVKPNDTITGIAAKEGVTPQHLQRINANRAIDPSLLQPTQCVDIVRGGCAKLANGG